MIFAPSQKATREKTKQHNRRLVLKTIYNHKQISRAEIARLTALTATTVSSVAAELIDSGLVEEGAPVSSARGKPPTLLAMVKDAYHMVCLDLARSTFQGAIINLRGEILERMSMPVNGRTGDAALALVYALIDALLPAGNSSILGIGIGAPGILDPTHGIVRNAVNFDWYDLPLHDLLADRYHLPVQIANDNHAAVLAEYTFGHRSDNPDLVVVKVAHGVGAGIILNGRLFLGGGFGAGEIGHVAVVENGEQCTCGNFGCLETVASSRAIVKQARAIAQENPDSLLKQLAATPDEIDITVVLRAIEDGDQTLQPIVAGVGHYLGVALANVVGVLGVPHIVIAGSVASLGQPLLDLINREVQQRSLVRMVSQTEVEMGTLGADIVILGAAALLMYHELGVV